MIVSVLVITVVASLIKSRNTEVERPERHVLEDAGVEKPAHED